MRLAVLCSPTSWYLKDLERAAAGEHEIVPVTFRDLASTLGPDGLAVTSAGVDLRRMDAVLVRTMPPGSLEQVVFRMDLLARLEATGQLVVNPPKAIEAAVDKYLTTARLQAAGLTVPRTFVCQTVEDALAGFAALGGDVVVKPLFGAEGRGIARLCDEAVAQHAFSLLIQSGAVLYLQEFVPHEGSDLRVLIVGERRLGDAPPQRARLADQRQSRGPARTCRINGRVGPTGPASGCGGGSSAGRSGSATRPRRPAIRHRSQCRARLASAWPDPGRRHCPRRARLPGRALRPAAPDDLHRGWRAASRRQDEVGTCASLPAFGYSVWQANATAPPWRAATNWKVRSMKCPQCGADNDRVIDSRASHDGYAIRRRRECLACQCRYNTFERVDDPMRCPFCHEDSNRVLESLAGEGGFSIRRRRECLICRRQYTTFERSEERSIKVIKKGGVRVPFDRQKIKQGLEKACWKRPISDEQIDEIVSAIETEVHAKFDAEVETTSLGELVMQHLRTLRPGGVRPLCQRLSPVPGCPRFRRRTRADVGGRKG